MDKEFLLPARPHLSFLPEGFFAYWFFTLGLAKIGFKVLPLAPAEELLRNLTGQAMIVNNNTRSLRGPSHNSCYIL